MTRTPHDDQPPAPPLLRVVRGDATADEIAALVAVLLARSADAEASGPARSVSGSWADRTRQLRRPLSPGPGAWRRSALPG
jgi:acyl-CoA carboxylase epsilon subunit